MGAGLLALAAAAPASVTGVGLVHLFNRPGPLGLIYDSSAILVIAQAIRALPFAVLALVPAFRRVPLDLEEAAALDGCGPLRRLCHVALPMCLHGLAVAWFLAFVLSLGEVGASVLVTPPGEATLAIHFYTQVHAGVYPTTAAMCLALLALAGVPAAAFTALVAPRLEGAPRSLIGPAAAPRSPATP
jgi:iron(III) transport system permease protein